MPLLTFYALVKPRGTRVPIGSLDYWPSDWVEFKARLEEAMARLYRERRQTELLVLLEHHMAGKFALHYTRGGYKLRKVGIKRECEATLKVNYNPRLGRVEVTRAWFNSSLRKVAEGYYRMEKEVQWRVPPLIPKEHRDLSDPKTYFLGFSAVRYADYGEYVKPAYSVNEKEPRTDYGYEPKRRLTYERAPG